VFRFVIQKFDLKTPGRTEDEDEEENNIQLANDYTKVDEKLIKKAGIAGVVRPSKTTVQVIVGPKVQFVHDELKKML
jgi:PTS system N-acetylglucosamine-specific IIC component